MLPAATKAFRKSFAADNVKERHDGAVSAALHQPSRGCPGSLRHEMTRLRLLGGVDLRTGAGVELRGVLAQPGQLALLAYLAAARPRGFHRRDKLIGLFWPEATQERARNALRQAVHRLRRAL